MFSVFAVLVYMAAMAIPVWLLYHFGSGHWFWHVFAVMIGLLLGVVPLPAVFSNPTYDLIVGFVFVFLIVWGIGGLFPLRSHHEKHA
jgi:hypothetical protein